MGLEVKANSCTPKEIIKLYISEKFNLINKIFLDLFVEFTGLKLEKTSKEYLFINKLFHERVANCCQLYLLSAPSGSSFNAFTVCVAVCCCSYAVIDISLMGINATRCANSMLLVVTPNYTNMVSTRLQN
jgi:hypothetical protein